MAPALKLFWEGWFVPVDKGPKEAVIASVVAVERFVDQTTPLRQAEGAAVLFAAAYVVVLWRRPRLGLLLLAPLAIAFVLAMLRIAPLGTGRTDIYLYPALVIAVAVAVDALARRARSATTLAALAAAVPLFLFTPTVTYPLDDVAPLVAEVEARSLPGDAILTYPWASYQYALYTGRAIDFSRSDTTVTGFRLQVERENAFVPTESWPRDALNFAAMIERIQRTHDSVWVIVSPRGEPVIDHPEPRPGASDEERFRVLHTAYELPFGLRALRRAFDVEHVTARLRQTTLQQYSDRLMRRAGYRRVGPVRVREGASLTHWLR